MKKATLLIILFLIGTSPAKPIQIYPIFGFQISKYSLEYKNTLIDFSFHPFIQLGSEINFKISPNITLSAAALISWRGSIVKVFYTESDYISGHYFLNTISFPVLLKIFFNNKSLPYFLVGPSILYVYSHDLELENQDSFDLMDTTKSIEIGFETGIGIQFRIAKLPMFIELRYFYGFPNLLESENKIESISTHSIQIVSGIFFGKKS